MALPPSAGLTFSRSAKGKGSEAAEPLALLSTPRLHAALPGSAGHVIQPHPPPPHRHQGGQLQRGNTFTVSQITSSASATSDKFRRKFRTLGG